MTASQRTRSSLLLVAALGLVTTTVVSAQGIERPRVPLRTAIKEINTLRAEYTDLYNKKNAAALTAMYLPDAVVVRADGSMLLGQTAIGKALGEDAAGWKSITITSDTMRVYGNTAWDVGTLTSQSSESGTSLSQHYLVVLRRGVQTWRISSLAVVPETHTTAAK